MGERETTVDATVALAHLTGAEGRSMPNSGAQTLRRHNWIRRISTIILALIPSARPGPADFGYSVSVFRGVGLTTHFAGLHTLWRGVCVQCEPPASTFQRGCCLSVD